MYRVSLIFIFVLIAGLSFSQSKYSISGTIRDSATGETAIGVNVWIPELSTGVITNGYGFFSLTLPEGKYNVTISYIGYNTRVIPVDLTKNIKLDVEISDKSTTLQEVVISGEKKDANITTTQMSSVKLDMKTIKTLPVFFGETDILKTILLLPGVKTIGDGNTSFYVRGGGADQNLIILDEAPVYNASHVLGFFSVFNGDAIKDINLIKGGIPAEYGGRLSSVLDIKMNDGNNKRLGVSGGLGLISSRLTLEGPIVKDKGSFIISGRRTYADLVLKMVSSRPEIKNSTLYFYDLNAKGNYRVNDKNRIYLSGYFGRDAFVNNGRLSIDWGNATGTLRWNHIFNDKMFLNTSLIFSDYQYNIDVTVGSNDFGITSSIRDYGLKSDLEYYPNNLNKIKLGFYSTLHQIAPGSLFSNGSPLINDRTIDNKYSLENAIYLSNEQTLNEKIVINYGLRFSAFYQIGPGKIFTFDTLGVPVDTTTYTTGQLIQPYYNIEPRISARYKLNDKSSIKASYTRTVQYIQLLSNSNSSTPTDLWIGSSPVIKPQLCDQYALGYFRNFKDNMFETSVEVYYKNMQNQIDYKAGADLILNPYVESQLYFGKGYSYGIELFVKKAQGKLTGWIGYTFSRTIRQFKEIDNGADFPARWDRIHDGSIVLSYTLNKRWTFSATWVYGTGNAVTFPVGKYMVGDKVLSLYTDRNGYRMPAYHRGDLSATLYMKVKGNWVSDWNFSIFNFYGNKNAYSIDFRQDPYNADKSIAVKTWLFSVVPAVTYNFKF